MFQYVSIFLAINFVGTNVSLWCLLLYHNKGYGFPSEYDHLLKYDYKEENSHSCDSYIYGCCEIHASCILYKDGLEIDVVGSSYNESKTYTMSYNSITVPNEVKVDERGSNCPGIRVLTSAAYPDDPYDCGEFGCCELNTRCDMLRQFPYDNEYRQYFYMMNQDDSNYIDIQKKDREGYNCPPDTDIVKGMINIHTSVDMKFPIYLAVFTIAVIDTIYISLVCSKMGRDQKDEERKTMIARSEV